MLCLCWEKLESAKTTKKEMKKKESGGEGKKACPELKGEKKMKEKRKEEKRKEEKRKRAEIERQRKMDRQPT